MSITEQLKTPRSSHRKPGTAQAEERQSGCIFHFFASAPRPYRPFTGENGGAVGVFGCKVTTRPTQVQLNIDLSRLSGDMLRADSQWLLQRMEIWMRFGHVVDESIFETRPNEVGKPQAFPDYFARFFLLARFY